MSLTNGGTCGTNDFRDIGWHSQIPFYGRSDGTTGHYCIHDQSYDIQGGYIISRDLVAITTAAPDDKGNYTVQRPLVCENRRPNDTNAGSYNTQMNRPYGESKNVYLSDDDGLSIMTTGRTIDGKEHITVGVESSMFSGGSLGISVLMLNEA
jgi:hypothetical protein